jgi:hypothetical protein
LTLKQGSVSEIRGSTANFSSSSPTCLVKVINKPSCTPMNGATQGKNLRLAARGTSGVISAENNRIAIWNWNKIQKFKDQLMEHSVLEGPLSRTFYAPYIINYANGLCAKLTPVRWTNSISYCVGLRQSESKQTKLSIPIWLCVKSGSTKIS